jgi:hypothetical protein
METLVLLMSQNLKRELKPVLEDPCEVTYPPVPRSANLPWVECMPILGILFSMGGESYDQEDCHGHMGKSTHQDLRFCLQTGNFPLRTLIRIITTLITEGRWGI